MAKSLNQVQLIGNLTRDPELKYTPQGTAVCTFSIATNRAWKTDTGEDKEEADFHRVVAWRQLAEICGKLLKKGSKTFVSGRLSTRSWDAPDGQKKFMTEVVISDMILLSGGGSAPISEGQAAPSQDNFDDIPDDFAKEFEDKKEDKTSKKAAPKSQKDENKEDIPF